MAGRGKKECPGCKKEIGVRTKKCSFCGHDFYSQPKTYSKNSKKDRKFKQNKNKLSKGEGSNFVKREVVEIEEKKSYKEKKQFNSPDENADIIINYGYERARLLFNLHRWGQTWSHVNWKRVEEALKEKEEALRQEEEVFKEEKDIDKNADRIINYGHEKAKILFNLHKRGETWSHVNWKKIEEVLTSIEKELKKKELEEEELRKRRYR